MLLIRLLNYTYLHGWISPWSDDTTETNFLSSLTIVNASQKL